MFAVVLIGWIVMVIALAGAGYILATVAAMCWLMRRQHLHSVEDFPAISVLIPMRGNGAGQDSAISSLLLQDYPGDVQIVYGVRDASDPAIATVEKLKARYPSRDVVSVVDERLHGTNRKVSNLANMVSAVKHTQLVMLDSDIEVPQNYLRTLASDLTRPDIGLATCLYAGQGAGFWAGLSAMGITYQFLPSACLAVVSNVWHPCFGSTIALKRPVLEEIGGLGAFANYLADDYEIGHAVRNLGLRLAYPPMLVSHTCSERSFAELWFHEQRWARTNRVIEPVVFRLSFFTHPAVLALIGAALLGFRPLALGMLVAIVAVRLFQKAVMDRMVGRRTGSYWLMPVRDFLSFAVYLASLLGSAVQWRGRKFKVDRHGVISQAQEH